MRAFSWLVWSPVLASLACGGTTPQPATALNVPAATTWTGSIEYEYRTPTVRGVSQAITHRPLRFARIALVDVNGTELAEGSLNETGQFEISGPPEVSALVVQTSLNHNGHELAVTSDAQGRTPHEVRVSLEARTPPIHVVVPDGDPASGAMHILDTLYTGVGKVREWTAQTLPPFFAYWGRGVTTEWSFYFGRRGENRYGIELLGGEPERRHATDTDEHDAMIVLHELGHFVMDMISTDSSQGGMHPRGVLIDPGLAWEEGRATWFAGAVSGSPWYRDTIGMEPGGSLRVDHNIEIGLGPTDVRGLGSESSVSETLWDLMDGAEGYPDDDNDGVALGPAVLLQAMIAERQDPRAFPCLPTFLSDLVRSHAVDRQLVKALLEQNREPAETLPEGDHMPWPLILHTGQLVSGKIDGITNPAPSGGPPRPTNGIDAIDVYRIDVERAGWLGVELRIAGSGLGSNQQDLDVELRDIRADVLQSSRGEANVENLQEAVQPGSYLIYVRDGGAGNRASYTLRAWIR